LTEDVKRSTIKAEIKEEVAACMNEMVLLPDERLRYISHETEGTTIIIYVQSIDERAICPYCGEASDKVHSRYTRKLQDLPIQGNKVKLVIDNKKYFCVNRNCEHKTFAESFSFFEPKATKTKRLQEEILRVSLTQSSLSAERYLRNSIADVGKSTICNMLKKTRKNY
jgi:transposase